MLLEPGSTSLPNPVVPPLLLPQDDAILSALERGDLRVLNPGVEAGVEQVEIEGRYIDLLESAEIQASNQRLLLPNIAAIVRGDCVARDLYEIGRITAPGGMPGWGREILAEFEDTKGAIFFNRQFAIELKRAGLIPKDIDVPVFPHKSIKVKVVKENGKSVANLFMISYRSGVRTIELFERFAKYARANPESCRSAFVNELHGLGDAKSPTPVGAAVRRRLGAALIFIMNVQLIRDWALYHGLPASDDLLKTTARSISDREPWSIVRHLFFTSGVQIWNRIQLEISDLKEQEACFNRVMLEHKPERALLKELKMSPAERSVAPPGSDDAPSASSILLDAQASVANIGVAGLETAIKAYLPLVTDARRWAKRLLKVFGVGESAYNNLVNAFLNGELPETILQKALVNQKFQKITTTVISSTAALALNSQTASQLADPPTSEDLVAEITSEAKSFLENLKNERIRKQLEGAICLLEQNCFRDIKKIANSKEILEARIHNGPGYRILFVRRDQTLHILHIVKKDSRGEFSADIQRAEDELLQIQRRRDMPQFHA